jgi:hypothetical protein
MIRLPRARTVLVMLAGLVLLVAAVPATAQTGPTPNPDATWKRAICATGAFTQTMVYESDNGLGVRLDGWIQPCAGTPDGNSFALMLYTAEGHRGKLRPYAPATGPTGFTAFLEYGRYAVYGTPHAVCVVYDYTRRVSCAELDTVGADGLPAVLPVPTNDPRVTVPVVTTGGMPPDPTCGTCL